MADAWFDHFWASPANVPESLGFGQFSQAHLMALVIIAAGVSTLVLAYRRSDARQRSWFRLIVGMAVFVMEVFRQVAFISLHIYTPDILPLHVCAIAEFAVMIDAIRPNSWLREYLYAMGSWGPACAILFPDWAHQPIFNIYTWQSFGVHGLLLAYILMIIVTREFRPSPRHLFRAAVIVLGAAVIAGIVNVVYGTNFWFLNTGSPGSPLEPIQSVAGPYYLPALGVLLSILWTIMYLPWRHHTQGPRAAQELDPPPTEANTQSRR